VSEEQVSDFLEHHGVKGMKWGVRRNRRNEQLFKRASEKGASLATKVRAGSRTGLIDLARGKGFRGAANIKYNRMTARTERMKAGQATVRDRIVHIGSTRVGDIVPVKAANANKKTTSRSDKALVAAAGAVMVANLLAKSR
jgi:hypothetical protein